MYRPRVLATWSRLGRHVTGCLAQGGQGGWFLFHFHNNSEDNAHMMQLQKAVLSLGHLQKLACHHQTSSLLQSHLESIVWSGMCYNWTLINVYLWGRTHESENCYFFLPRRSRVTTFSLHCLFILRLWLSWKPGGMFKRLMKHLGEDGCTKSLEGSTKPSGNLMKKQ